MATVDSFLLWLVENPGVFICCAMVLIVVAWRFAFMAGLKFTVRQESRAVQIERTKEHEARAASLRLVARRMTDDNEAA